MYPGTGGPMQDGYGMGMGQEGYGMGQGGMGPGQGAMITVDQAAIAKGPKLVKVFPTVLTYIPPYGMKKQDFLVKLTCIASQNVGYKVQANNDLWYLYTVTPTCGVVHAGQTVNINFQLNDNLTAMQLQSIPGQHLFQIQAMFWPAKVTQFDPDMWNQIQQLLMGEVQTVVVESKLDFAGNFQMIAASAYNQQPCYVPMDPMFGGMYMPPTNNLLIAPTSQNAVGSDVGGQIKHVQESVGPDLIYASPTKLSFKPPYGLRNQAIKVTIECLCLKGTAFKVQTHKLSHAFYSVKPSRGVVRPDHTETLSFEMVSGNEEKDILNADPKSHKFNILALRWPDTIKEFDADVWKKFEATKKDEMQTITLEVDLINNKNPRDKPDNGTPPHAQSPKQSKTSPLVTLSKSSVFFKMPNGRMQNVILKAKCISNSVVAYKIMTNKPDLYVVKPSKGLLHPGKPEDIAFEMHKTATIKNIQGGDHRFNFMTMPWPPKVPHFDIELWKKYDKTKHSDMHVITLEVEHK